jgi:RHS repeat-associated protein
VVRTQVWGQDLSGTMQGAGGVGGLLAVRHGGQTYVPLMDGNGNVMGLQGLGGAKDGQTVARYDYDAFGNRITNTAPELGEEVNPFGFSTKFTDEETGLVYYGYRYYSAELGRWLSRDPIGERGGINLYGMVGNDPVNRVDRLGHAPANFKCGGTCGANVDDWIVDEINAQRAGWTGGNKSISGYLRWANGNQRYKDPAFFEFSKDTKCGTIDTGSAVGCGSSVTLCGQCVRSAILGNLMYGLIAADAGFPMEDTVNAPGDTKRFLRMTVSANDETSYLAGDIMGTKLPKNITLKDVCYRLNGIAFGLPSALRETNASGGENDLTSCRPCQEKTKESRHGGSDKPRWTR